MEIAPEPDESERAVLAAFVSEEAQAAAEASPSAWARAALEEGIASDDGHGSAPPL